MRPLTATDLIDFHTSDYDLLVLTASGEFAHLDRDAIDTSSFDDGRASTYDYATTTDGDEVKILLQRDAITDGEFFPETLGAKDLDPAIAAEMAAIINADGLLDVAVHQATLASERWEQQSKAADTAAAARAEAVAAVVAFTSGNQSAAARAIGIDQSTVNKLVKKLTTAK